MVITGRAQLKTLSSFDGGGLPATSFYLDTDKGRLSKKEITVSFKRLLQEGRGRLEASDLDRDKKESLAGDLKAIAAFGVQSLGSHKHAGLAMFSCSRKGFLQVLDLPHGPRNRIVFDQNFYVRPLLAILEKYRRICVLLLSRRDARLYEVHMDGIKPLDSLTSDVPGRVKDAGFEGSASRRIERNIEGHVLEHFKKASQLAFDLFKKGRFDWLFLGCDDDGPVGVESVLHAYLKERLKGRVKAKPSDAPTKVLKEAVELEERLNMDEEVEVVGRLIAELERGGKACSGIKETLQRLNQFEVQSLVVTHNYSREGHACPNCRFLYLEEATCPVCLRKTDAVVDIVDEAIETAATRACAVRQVTPPTKLDRYGKIGAFLKYKI
jgi:peptide subunit release factor 1 (eRF1)